jgi:hypothetical protein
MTRWSVVNSAQIDAILEGTGLASTATTLGRSALLIHRHDVGPRSKSGIRTPSFSPLLFTILVAFGHTSREAMMDHHRSPLGSYR